MGLFQRAVETYDANQANVGVYYEGKEPLAPVGHTLSNADIEVTINNAGVILSARRRDKDESKIIIPVTEASGGRSGTNAYMVSHPLCDRLKYYVAEENFFLPQLANWESSQYSHPFLTAIRKYLEKKSLQPDLEILLGTVAVNDFICWRVEGIQGEEPCCWKNNNLHKSFSDYYLNNIENRTTSLCMISGLNSPTAIQHPKNIVAMYGNAKLISSNDTSGYTFRGRISEDWQAATISFEASQKAHNALRWLVSTQGVCESIGNRVYLCWEPKGKQIPKPMNSLRKKDAAPEFIPSDYKDSLEKALMGYEGAKKYLYSDTVVITALDAATPGRLAIVYYNEISLSLFFQRLKDWDTEFCWYYGKNGIKSPNLKEVIDCAFGIQRKSYLETDDKIMRQHVQRLLDCKVRGGFFPFDILQLLCNRASTPQAFNESNWRTILRTACAAIQKYRYDSNLGGNEMSWNLNHNDRSFQFGRLLAAMERAENDYYIKSNEDRQTNAIKYMSEFRQRPWLVFERVNLKLHQAYLNRIEPWQVRRYEQLVSDVCFILSKYPESELNKPLENIYLMGYELQRKDFFVKHDVKEMEE